MCNGAAPLEAGRFVPAGEEVMYVHTGWPSSHRGAEVRSVPRREQERSRTASTILGELAGGAPAGSGDRLLAPVELPYVPTRRRCFDRRDYDDASMSLVGFGPFLVGALIALWWTTSVHVDL